MEVKKLGQPVPESNFIAEVKSGSPQPAQAKIPGRFSLFSGLVPARSVLSSRSTLYDSGGRRLRHSSLERLSGSPAPGPGRAPAVLSSRSPLYDSGGRRLRHSSLERLSGSSAEGTVAPAGR